MPKIWLPAVAAAAIGMSASFATANLGVSLEPTAEELDAGHQEAAALIDAGDYENALVKLNAMVESYDQDAEAYNLIGYTHRRMQSFDLAFENYERALAINPEHTGAHHYIGEAYLETDNLEKAEYHLAQLNVICLFGCDDYFELKEAVDLYRANYSS